MTVIHGRHLCCILNQFVLVPVKVSRLHTCIRQATVCTVNIVQQNQSSVSFHSCNENIPLTILSSILPKTPTFRVFLLPYPSPRPGAVLERYSVIDIIIHWTFESFKVFVLIQMKTRAPTRNFNAIVIRDGMWFQVTVSRNAALHPRVSDARSLAWWCDHYVFSKRLTSFTQWREATSTKYKDRNYISAGDLKLGTIYVVHSPTNALFINLAKSIKFTLKHTILSFLHVSVFNDHHQEALAVPDSTYIYNTR